MVLYSVYMEKVYLKIVLKHLKRVSGGFLHSVPDPRGEVEQGTEEQRRQI